MELLLIAAAPFHVFVVASSEAGGRICSVFVESYKMITYRGREAMAWRLSMFAC